MDGETFDIAGIPLPIIHEKLPDIRRTERSPQIKINYGQIAFEAFKESSGLDLCEWSRLSPSEKEVWGSVGDAVVSERDYEIERHDRQAYVRSP